MDIPHNIGKNAIVFRTALRNPLVLMESLTLLARVNCPLPDIVIFVLQTHGAQLKKIEVVLNSFIDTISEC